MQKKKYYLLQELKVMNPRQNPKAEKGHQVKTQEL